VTVDVDDDGRGVDVIVVRLESRIARPGPLDRGIERPDGRVVLAGTRRPEREATPQRRLAVFARRARGRRAAELWGRAAGAPRDRAGPEVANLVGRAAALRGSAPWAESSAVDPAPSG